MECSSCMYFVPNEKVLGREGECRANPPVPIAVPIQTQQGVSVGIQAFYPVLASSQWCGRYQAAKPSYVS